MKWLTMLCTDQVQRATIQFARERKAPYRYQEYLLMFLYSSCTLDTIAIPQIIFQVREATGQEEEKTVNTL